MAEEKKIDLKFDRLSRKQVSDMAKDTLKSGGVDVPDDPQARGGGDLSDAFNRAAAEAEQRARAAAAMPRFDPAI
jgi:hypothetical protein